MKILNYIVASLILLIATLAIGVVSANFIQIASAVFEGAKQLEPEIYVPLSITVTTAILGLAATLYTQVSNRKRDIDAAYRERKIEIYLQFLKTLERLALASKPELGGEPADMTQLTIDLMDIRTKAVLWGSPSVLQSISKLSKMNPEKPIEMFKTIDGIQRNMRKDLGLSNFGLGEMFFVKLSLNDPHELDALMSK